MMCVTAVDPYWLAEYGDRCYTIKESTFGRREKRRLEQTKVKDMEAELAEAVERKRKVEEEDARREMTPRTRILEGGKTPRVAVGSQSGGVTPRVGGGATPRMAGMREPTPKIRRRGV